MVAGRSLVIHGPPGTGKSQTIANLIAAMVARGRKVLFVAEKRAAIDAVLSRLVGVNLGDLVLDIHEGARDRQRIAADLGRTLDLAEHATAPDTTALHRRLTDRQQRLRRHAAALHRVHEPWRLSAYQVQSALLGVPAKRARVSARLTAPEEITPDLADEIRDELREFTRLGGFAMRPGSTPWFGAAIGTRAQAHEAIELAGDPAPAGRCRRAGCPAGRAAAANWACPMRLPLQLSRTDPADSGPRTAAPGGPARSGVPRAARAAPRGAARSGRRLLGARSGDWPRAGRAAAAVRLLPALAQGLGRVLHGSWRRCGRLAPLAGLEDAPEAAAAALAADQETPWKLPRLRRTGRRFRHARARPRCSTRWAMSR